MSRRKRFDLREEIRNQLAFALDRGGATPGLVADLVIGSRKDLVEDLASDLARSALCEYARQELRKQEASTKAARAQLDLPIELQHLALPPIISVPHQSEDGDAETDGANAVIWLSWKKATLAQVLGHLTLLDESIRRDVAKREQWQEFCTYCTKACDGDLDAIVGDFLPAPAPA